MAPTSPTLRILSGMHEVEPAAWNALAGASAFVGHAFLHALEASGVVDPAYGWAPSHLTLWRGERLVAAMPAYVRTDSRGEFVFDWGWAEAAESAGIRYYPKLTVAVPFTPATGPRLLVAPGEDEAAAAAALSEGALALVRELDLSSAHLLFPTEEEAARLEESGWARRLSIQFHWQNEGYSTYDDFLARFSSKQRANLRRERAAVAKQGISVRTLRGEEARTFDPALAHALYRSTVDKYLWGVRHLNLDFFARLLRDVPGTEVVVAEREGKVIAGAINLATDTHLYGRYWGAFEEHAFLHFDVCYYHSIEECIRRGLRVFEPGAGGEHKLSRGFQPTFTHSAHWIANPGLDRAVRDFLRKETLAWRARVESYRSSTGLRPRER